MCEYRCTYLKYVPVHWLILPLLIYAFKYNANPFNRKMIARQILLGESSHSHILGFIVLWLCLDWKSCVFYIFKVSCVLLSVVFSQIMFSCWWKCCSIIAVTKWFFSIINIGRLWLCIKHMVFFPFLLMMRPFWLPFFNFYTIKVTFIIISIKNINNIKTTNNFQPGTDFFYSFLYTEIRNN